MYQAYMIIWLLKSLSLFQRIMENFQKSKPFGLSFLPTQSINKIISMYILAPVFLLGLWLSIENTWSLALEFYRHLEVSKWLMAQHVFESSGNILVTSEQISNTQRFLSLKENYIVSFSDNISMPKCHFATFIYLGFKKVLRTTRSKGKSPQQSLPYCFQKEWTPLHLAILTFRTVT